jgi:hypothetical protein
MKKQLLTLTFLLMAAMAIFTGCQKQVDKEPCDGIGQVCMENKSDSVITIQIMETHNTFTLEKDYMQCFELTGNQPYTFKVSGPSLYTEIDTTFMVLPCDNKVFVILQP